MNVVSVDRRQGLHAGNLRQTHVPAPKSKGFTLFEMVAFIIVAAILYSVAVNRYSDFPEAAERANFLAILTQLQTGLNLEMMLGVGSGSVRNIQDFADLNPMDMLLRAPSNYIGAFDSVDKELLPRRSWYFDLRTAELVYLINQPQNAYLLINSIEVPTEEIRFKIVITYRDPASFANLTYDELQAAIAEAQAENEVARNDSRLTNARISGAVLRPVVPFKWEGVEGLENTLEYTG